MTDRFIKTLTVWVTKLSTGSPYSRNQAYIQWRARIDTLKSPLPLAWNPQGEPCHILILRRAVTLEEKYQAKFYQAEKNGHGGSAGRRRGAWDQ